MADVQWLWIQVFYWNDQADIKAGGGWARIYGTDWGGVTILSFYLAGAGF